MEQIPESKDADLEKQKTLLMVTCCFEMGLHDKVIETVKQFKSGVKNSILFKPLFLEHQLYYIAGRSYDKVRNYQRAVDEYRKAISIMEDGTEKPGVDYKPLKLQIIRMRLGFSLILSGTQDSRQEGVEILELVQIEKKYQILFILAQVFQKADSEKALECAQRALRENCDERTQLLVAKCLLYSSQMSDTSVDLIQRIAHQSSMPCYMEKANLYAGMIKER